MNQLDIKLQRNVRASELLVFLFAILFSGFAAAGSLGVDGLTVNGRLKIATSHLYDLEDGSETGPQNYLAEIKAAWRPNRNVTLIGNFWYRGDLAPDNTEFTEPNGGLKNPLLGPPFPSSPFIVNTDSCNFTASIYCSKSSGIRSFDDFDDEVIREFSLKFRDPKRRYTFKIGKFQRGWGQSDGLRLLDILHAQDLRERFAFRDSDELRIPAWMISADFNFKRMGIAKPFEALGMKRPVLEVNWVPEVRHSAIGLNNPTPSGRDASGAFGLPWPDFVDRGFAHQSGWGAVGFGAVTHDREFDDFESSEAEISARLKFEALGGTATINVFSGKQDLPIVEMLGATVHVGSGFNDPSAAIANVPVDHATLIAALWAPNGALGPAINPNGVPGLQTGGYLPYLRAFAAGVGGIESPLTTLTGGGCADPFNGVAGLGCSVSVDVLLDYTYDQEVVGFSFTRDMGDFMAFGPKNTSPSLRLEMSFERDKPFNRSVVENPFNPSQLEMGAVANFVSPGSSIVERDVTSTMIGFDYPLWIPGWDGQEKSIFTSFQFFNIHTEDADHLMAQAPYGFSEVEKNQNYVTFLWQGNFDNGRLFMEGLFIRDFDNKGTFYRQRVDLNYFGNSIRPRIEWMYFDGRKETAPIGIFDDKDFIEFSLTYQF